MAGDLGAAPRRIDRRGFTLDDKIVDPVLVEARRSAASEKLLEIRVVVAEKQAVRLLEAQGEGPEPVMGADDLALALFHHAGPGDAIDPAPDVAEPGLREDVDRRRVRAAIMRRHPHQRVVGRRLRVFDFDIEIAVRIEEAGVDEFELARIAALAAGVLLEQPAIGIGRLRQLVEHAAVGVARDRVDIVVEFLHVLAVIALLVGEAEQAFLQDRVLAVPKGEREAE